MWRALPALLLSACFEPSFDNPTCGPGGACPDGYACMPDNVCRIPGVIVPDADPNAPDASLIDADPNAPDADPNAPDANILVDAPVLTGCASWTFTPSNVPCTDPIGAWDLTTSITYNTDTGMVSSGTAPTSAVVSQTGGGNARVVSVTSFSVGGTVNLTITGSIPLIVLVDGTATISGTIEGSASFENPGPGGNANECGTQLGNGGDGLSNGTSGGGGGGGSFGGGGRPGGTGTGGGAGLGNPGNTSTNLSLAPLRGGCRGGAGGSGAGTAGSGGAGGGAIQIAARDQITVNGMIRLGGGAARQGLSGVLGGAGGGGGGSGGGALLEAPAVSVTGILCANSGSGGGGASSSASGVNGQNAGCAGAAVGGSGGGGGSGDGGNGTHLTTSPGNGTSGSGGSGGGGGGGGGGAGVLRIRGTLSGTALTISPPATTVPL